MIILKHLPGDIVYYKYNGNTKCSSKNYRKLRIKQVMVKDDVEWCDVGLKELIKYNELLSEIEYESEIQNEINNRIICLVNELDNLNPI